MAVPMANDPPFATLNHVAGDLGIPSESALLRFGINPCGRLNTGDLIGQRQARDRVLTGDELRALWRATERIGYPYGPLYRLLLLTGLRLGEVCGASWPEFDLGRG